MSRPLLYSESFHKARKEKKCHGCCKTIKPTTKYKKYKGIWDCGFESYNHCLQCARKTKMMRNHYSYDQDVEIFFEDVIGQWSEFRICEFDRDL